MNSKCYLLFRLVNYCNPSIFQESESFKPREDTPQINCTCHEDEFRCNSSYMCIKKHSVCDYEKDCFDFSDEEGCEYFKCNTMQFKCSNDRCIEASHQCDGIDDCKDGKDGRRSSDEFGCKGN